MSIQPFEIAIPEEALTDLRERLERTRWPVEIGDNSQWQMGTNLGYLRELVAYWQTSYDWRAREREMNTLPQFRTEIDGVPIHFVHAKGKGPNPVPLIINHGRGPGGTCARSSARYPILLPTVATRQIRSM